MVRSRDIRGRNIQGIVGRYRGWISLAYLQDYIAIKALDYITESLLCATRVFYDFHYAIIM